MFALLDLFMQIFLDTYYILLEKSARFLESQYTFSAKMASFVVLARPQPASNSPINEPTICSLSKLSWSSPLQKLCLMTVSADKQIILNKLTKQLQYCQSASLPSMASRSRVRSSSMSRATCSRLILQFIFFYNRPYMLDYFEDIELTLLDLLRILTIQSGLMGETAWFRLLSQVWLFLTILLLLEVIYYLMIISLENFDQHGRTKPIINSPRSIQACKRQGIEPEQLLIKNIEQIKHLYKDGINDKKSLEIKLQHYETRRKAKLQLVRKERVQILTNVKPIYRPNHATNRTRVEVVEVEDKLEKKRIMDEVKAQLKQRQLELKQAKIAKKLQNLQSKKRQDNLRKQCMTVQYQKRKERNQLNLQVKKQIKVNTIILNEVEKQQKIQKAFAEKKNVIENLKKEKEVFYENKTQYCKELQQTMINQKKKKVDAKFEDLQKRQQEKQTQEQLYRRNLEEQKKKDQLWKETKRKQAEIEERKRNMEILQALKHKDMRIEEHLEEIQGKKSRYYNGKKQDREMKSQLVKKKLQQDESYLQKRRRIMEIQQEQRQKQQEQRRLNQKRELQSRKGDLIEKQKIRLEKLKEQQQDKQMSGQYILNRQREKQQQIQKIRKSKLQKQKQKVLLKELKLKQAEDNRKRLQKIEQYQKNQQIQKYNEKVNAIQKEKKQQKSVKVIRKVSRQQVQSQLKDRHSQQKLKKIEKKHTSVDRIQVLKQQAKKNPIETKQKLKMEQISKLIQNLKVQCNKEEYLMMKEEEDVQRQREELEKTAETVTQLRRLQKIHGVERARFQERLTALMKQNQQKVESYRRQLLQ